MRGKPSKSLEVEKGKIIILKLLNFKDLLYIYITFSMKHIVRRSFFQHSRRAPYGMCNEG